MQYQREFRGLDYQRVDIRDLHAVPARVCRVCYGKVTSTYPRVCDAITLTQFAASTWNCVSETREIPRRSG
eukprot:1085638-Rhodomonas_salina.3